MNNKQRETMIKQISYLAILINFIFAVIKIIIGLMSSSISIMSDAFNNLSDSMSSVITIISIKLSNKAPNAKHPLGYGRIEYLSGFLITSLILYLGITSLLNSIEAIFNPQALSISGAAMFIVFISIIGKYLLGIKTIAVGHKTNSMSLKASGKESLMDVLASILSLISISIYYFTKLQIDGYIGLVLSLFIIYTSVKLFSDTINSLLGERIDASLVNDIKEVIVKYENIKGSYDFIIHNYGPNKIYATANIAFNGNESTSDSYTTLYNLRNELYEKYHIIFTFGIYAIKEDAFSISSQTKVTQLIGDIEGLLSIHAFNINQELKLITFDVVVDFSIKDYAIFKEEIIKLVQLEFNEYKVKINIDLDYQ